MKITVPQRELFHWRRTRHGKKEVAVCQRITLAAVLSFSVTTAVVAAPSGGVITSGTGGISQSGAVTDITQSSQRLDIDWHDFSVAVGETVNFAQPDSLAVAINRVVGGVPSELAGALNANGRIFILNQAGVMFHQSAQVNVGALLATTATDMNVSALLDGEQYSFSGATAGSVVNHGSITVSDGGFAILAAPEVHNTGVIQADLGEIHLAATTAYTLDLRGDGLINFAIPAEAAQNIAGGVQAGGTLRARSGLVSLDARTATELVNGVVNLDGVIDADALVSGGQGGRVMLAATGDITTGTGAEIHVNNGATGKIALNAGGDIIATRLAVNTVSNRLSSATIAVQAGGSVHLSGGITATANSSTDRDEVPYAIADINVYSERGDITLSGDTLAASTVNGVEGAYAFGTAEAHANVNYSAARALTHNGHVTVRTRSYLGAERGDSEGHTYLALRSRDSGDVTVNGDLLLDAHATRNVYNSAQTFVNADLSAANNFVVNGGVSLTSTALAISVGRSGYYTDGACMASANASLKMLAGTTGSGDLIITDGLHVSGYGALQYGGTHSADAFVDVNLRAANDIHLSGERDALTVSATGHSTAQSATTSSADIGVSLVAGTAGTGNILMQGNVNISADAYLKDGRFRANAISDVEMQSPDDITIQGDIRVTSTLDAVAKRRYALGHAHLTIDAGKDSSGSLTVTGTTLVNTEAKVVDAVQPRTTTAYAQFTAPDAITTGAVTVSALGDISAGSNNDADVDANLSMNVWGGGDLTISGPISVAAHAARHGTDKAYANASAHLSAARHLTVNRAVTVSADALSDGGATDALSSADIVMQAGSSGSGHLHVTGDLQTRATAETETGVKSAVGSLTLSAADDLTVLGADPLASAAPAFVQGRESMSDEHTVDGDHYLTSLSLNAGGTLTVDVPPPPPEPEPEREPETESVPKLSADHEVAPTPLIPVVKDTEAAQLHHDDTPDEGKTLSDAADTEPTPLMPAPGANRLNRKVNVTVISAFNRQAGPQRHDISVSSQAVEHGALGEGEPLPLDSVIFEVDWDRAVSDKKTFEPLSALSSPLNEDEPTADKGERRRR